MIKEKKIKKIASNKKKHVFIEKELNEISKKVKEISTKGLTKDSINGYNKFFNDAKHFSLGIFQ